VYAALRDYRKTVDDYQQRAQALDDNRQDVDWPAVNANIQQFGLAGRTRSPALPGQRPVPKGPAQ